MERHIVHLDLDTFFVSVERLQNPKLIGVPVVIGGSSDRGVVASCSYEARQFGIHSAMPMRLARQLCPQAIVVRGDHDRYGYYSRMVTEIMLDKAPVVEKASIDEHYLDLTGMDKYFGCYKWADELRQTIIKETGLPISFGLSVNKTVSKVATGQAKPNGQLQILSGTERSFLAPLSIKKIPGIGDKTFRLLTGMGLDRVAVIQQMPVEAMQQVLGENGNTIWRKANGLDDSLVIPYSEQKSMSTEQTFDRDTIDMFFLRKTLVGMVEQLSFDLRQQNRQTGCLVVKIRYSDFNTETKQARIPYTNVDRTIMQKVLELSQKLYSKRMLIRLIGIKFTDLIYGGMQIDIFNDTIEQVNLNRALDSIKNRFGGKSVMKAISL